MTAPASYDIFCRVVDNFGDAGFCWRLARVLSLEHRARVVLWIDDAATLARLVPQSAGAGEVDGVQIRSWGGDTARRVGSFTPADVVVEAFGCGLPDAYIDAMLRQPRDHVWIVLEHLTAEAWATSHHGLPSPHPKHALDRFFIFPGFAAGTGGLLREDDLFARRGAFGHAERAAFWSCVGHCMPPTNALVVSLFAYEDAPLEDWLDCWVSGEQKIVVAVPEGELLIRALEHLGVASGERLIARGALELRALPFLSQYRYDALLWSCDLNFVRGEDSFVRAQWAARPFIWHVYRQEMDAHLVKLDAFLALYSEELTYGAAGAVKAAMHAWNGHGDVASTRAAWQALMGQRPILERHAKRWADRVGTHAELAANLAQFCAARLK